MEEIIDKMEMIDGDYSVQSNGLIVKAVNIDNGKIKIGGFKRDINDIPVNYPPTAKPRDGLQIQRK